MLTCLGSGRRSAHAAPPHALPPPLSRGSGALPVSRPSRLAALAPCRPLVSVRASSPPRPRRNLRPLRTPTSPPAGRPPRRLEPIERRQLEVEIDRARASWWWRKLKREGPRRTREICSSSVRSACRAARRRAPPPPAVAGCPTGPRRHRQAGSEAHALAGLPGRAPVSSVTSTFSTAVHMFCSAPSASDPRGLRQTRARKACARQPRIEASFTFAAAPWSASRRVDGVGRAVARDKQMSVRWIAGGVRMLQ